MRNRILAGRVHLAPVLAEITPGVSSNPVKDGGWPDPAQRARIAEIRDNLIARIAEAEHEGRLGEVEGLKVSLAGAEDKLAQIGRRSRTTVDLGIPALSLSR